MLAVLHNISRLHAESRFFSKLEVASQSYTDSIFQRADPAVFTDLYFVLTSIGTYACLNTYTYMCIIEYCCIPTTNIQTYLHVQTRKHYFHMTHTYLTRMHVQRAGGELTRMHVQWATQGLLSYIFKQAHQEPRRFVAVSITYGSCRRRGAVCTRDKPEKDAKMRSEITHMYDANSGVLYRPLRRVSFPIDGARCFTYATCAASHANITSVRHHAATRRL